MQPSVKRRIKKIALWVVGVIVALVLAFALFVVYSRSIKDHALRLSHDYNAQTEATQTAALRAAGQFEACQAQAKQSKAAGDADPASKFFSCFSPSVLRGDGSLTGPYLLFGAALMDPAAPEKAREREKLLQEGYRQATQTYEKEVKNALKFDRDVESTCMGNPWAKTVCSTVARGLLQKDAQGRWTQPQKAPLLMRQMQDLDVAFWQANHPAEVREQLTAQAQVAGDPTQSNKVALSAPWIPASIQSQKLRQAQMAEWSQEVK